MDLNNQENLLCHFKKLCVKIEQKKKIETHTNEIVEEIHANNKNRNELDVLLSKKLVTGDKLYIT
ncbi:hypothetical protein AALH86_11920, partial [Staphylococcus equorum]